MGTLKNIILIIVFVVVDLSTIVGYKDILTNNYYELGTNDESKAVYVDTDDGTQYATRLHDVLFVIPLGIEKFYAIVDYRNEEKPILYTAIITDNSIIEKLENQEKVRLQGLKTYLPSNYRTLYSSTLHKLRKESPELQGLRYSRVVIDTTYDRKMIILFLIAGFVVLIYFLLQFFQSFQKKQ